METKKEIYKALAGFQEEVPPIHEGSDGYNYTYSDLNSIFIVIKPLLKKYDLGFTQLLNNSNLETILFHVKSGEFLKSSVELPKGVVLKGMNTFQINGSSITYYRRYSLSAMLGLITEKDLDACGEEKKNVKNSAPTKPQKKPKKKLDDKGFNYLKSEKATEKHLENALKFRDITLEQKTELEKLLTVLKNK